jgi:hypothetical protein
VDGIQIDRRRERGYRLEYKAGNQKTAISAQAGLTEHAHSILQDQSEKLITS